jgi:hypothetical protein
VTWPGAFVGAAWAAVIGFACGWLLGFTHNRTIDGWLLLTRIRTDLSQRRNFVDHLH